MQKHDLRRCGHQGPARAVSAGESGQATPARSIPIVSLFRSVLLLGCTRFGSPASSGCRAVKRQSGEFRIAPLAETSVFNLGRFGGPPLLNDGNRVMLCSERRAAPLVHCGSQAWVTTEKQGELGESGVQILDAPQGVGRLQIRVVAGECDELRLLSVRWCGGLGGCCVAACGCWPLRRRLGVGGYSPLLADPSRRAGGVMNR